MLSSNIKIDETPTSLYSMAIALVMEYVKHRGDYWDSFTHQAAASISWLIGSATAKKPTVIKTKKDYCVEIITKLNTLALDKTGAPEELMITIFDIADLAREMQAKQVNESTKFSAETSLLATMLHAIRTSLVKILRKNHANVYENKVINLKNELTKKKNVLSNFYDKKFDMTGLKKEYQQIRNKLLDLQDMASIKEASEEDHFPHDLPSIEIKEEIKNVDFNLNAPVVYCPDFYIIYLRTELFINQKRFLFFEQAYDNELKKLRNFGKSPEEGSEDGVRRTSSQKNMAATDTQVTPVELNEEDRVQLENSQEDREVTNNRYH